MFRTLRRDIHGFQALECPIKQAKQPDLDPLSASRYWCVCWVDHLYDWCSNPVAGPEANLQDGGKHDVVMKGEFLYWLEAPSICRSIWEGVLSMVIHEALIQVILNLMVLSIHTTY